MIRPFTCLTLIAACGAGLYLYQVKHRAQMVDRDITRTMKQTEQARDRISLLKTEWAALTATSRLSGLAAEHLQLQPLQPAQFVRLEDLRGRLPPVAPVLPTPAAMDEPPVAAAAPSLPALAMTQAAPVALKPAMPAAGRPPLAASLPASVKPPVVTTVQLAAAHPAPKHPLAAGLTPREAGAHEPAIADPAMHEPAAALHHLFAPVMPAYAPAPVVVHAPTVQTASAVAQQPAPFAGSALGMARSVLAAPVPVQSAGYASGQ